MGNFHSSNKGKPNLWAQADNIDWCIRVSVSCHLSDQPYAKTCEPLFTWEGMVGPCGFDKTDHNKDVTIGIIRI